MKFILDFIDTNKEVSQTLIFEELKCGQNEALILRTLCIFYMNGTWEMGTIELLQSSLEVEDFEYLKHLDLLENLLDLGWIVQSSFEQLYRGQEKLKIEILQSSFSLSHTMLKLLEDGALDVNLPAIEPYVDHLDYLQDQFYMVELLEKLSVKHSFMDSTSNIGKARNNLLMINKRIEERLKITEASIIVEDIFRDKELDDKEKKIFLVLLKEEYNGGEGEYRDMNKLIEIVSNDEYEKIKNRSLLEEGSKMISEELIGYDEIINVFGTVSRSFYIEDDILQLIIHPNKKKKDSKLKLDMLIEEQELFEQLHPKTTLDDVVLHPKTRETLNNLMKQLDKRVVNRLKAWGIKDKNRGIDARIIFYGHPGTGKTMTAMSLSKSLKRPILSFDCSCLLSMYVGESEKNVRKIFDEFKELSKKSKTEPILLLNEADQFLSSRSAGAGDSVDKMHNQMQNIFLEQIERFEGILVATTNLLGNIDKAFSRRFNYKIEFKKPDLKQRELLWQMMLPENADFEENFDLKRLAKYELTGGQINMIVKNTAYSVAVRDEATFSTKDFMDEIEKEMGSSFEKDGLSMGFRV
jgi:SpoVK/Ycf46/Vps4 family AAA+-type ATPase